MVNHDFFLVTPDAGEEIIYDMNGLIPYQLVVGLETGVKYCLDPKTITPTSVNAGAATLRNLFHSSCSDATIFLPKNRSGVYNSSGFGKRALDPITS